MKTFFIPCVFGFANKGDWALFDSLKKTLREKFQNCRIYAVCKNASLQKEKIPDVIWIEQLGSSNRQGVLRKLCIIMGYVKMALLYLFFPFAKSNYTNALKESDLIIACPGGYLHDANFSIFTLLVNLTLAVRSKKKIIYAPQSIGPINNKYFRYLTKKVLKNANAIFTRENFSYQYCINNLECDPSKVYEVIDMAFYDCEYKKNTIKENLNNKKYIACTLIKWLYPHMDNKELLYKKYLKALVDYFEYVIEELHLDVVILKQIEKYGIDSGDEQIFKDIKPYIKSQYRDNIHFIEDEITYMEMKGIIKDAQFFVGSRMHSNIFALQQGIPVIAISYQPKTEYIMSSLGLSDYSLSIIDLTKEDLINVTQKLQTSWTNKDHIIAEKAAESKQILLNVIQNNL